MGTASAPHFVYHRFPTGDVLFSVAELASVMAHGHRLSSQWAKSGAGERAIVYGTYLPQKQISESQALKDMLSCRGRGLGYLFSSVVRVLELVDVEVFKPVSNAEGLPFAALIGIDRDGADYLRKPDRCVAAFLRYSNLDAAANIANRPGVFAIRGIRTEVASDADWRSGFDRGRAEAAARAVVCAAAPG